MKRRELATFSQFMVPSNVLEVSIILPKSHCKRDGVGAEGRLGLNNTGGAPRQVKTTSILPE